MKSTIVQSAFSLLSPAGPGARLSVLLFHKVPTLVDPLTTGELDLARFEKILDFLSVNTTVLPLPEAAARLQAGTLAQPRGGADLRRRLCRVDRQRQPRTAPAAICRPHSS